MIPYNSNYSRTCFEDNNNSKTFLFHKKKERNWADFTRILKSIPLLPCSSNMGVKSMCIFLLFLQKLVIGVIN